MPDADAPPLPSPDDVRAAAGVLRGVANRTPVVTSRTLDALAGARVFVKGECWQRSGAFKFRGAYNALSRLPADERRRGVVTYSSGNHAQALALAGRLLDVPVTVVMPDDAPAAKRDATLGYGAEVVAYDPRTAVREAVAEEIRGARGLALIPPYDHADVIAGQGTAALELLDEAGPLDVVLAPCGGGGLLSGTALAVLGAGGGCRVVGVEPEVADDATRSFRTGTLHTVRNPPTVADGLRTPSLGRLTFPLVRAHVHEMRTVTEAQIVDAMRFLWTRMKVMAEPSGAVALAGLLADPEPFRGAGVGVLVSGGNVDIATACALLTE
jgi:threo-3-hydroxy-L-aspartate ammonia-lyase